MNQKPILDAFKGNPLETYKLIFPLYLSFPCHIYHTSSPAVLMAAFVIEFMKFLNSVSTCMDNNIP